jgi:tRNA nucleotidyltransferase/poly(A) polymerase
MAGLSNRTMWLACAAAVFGVIVTPAAQAQTPEIDAVKGKIFDARMASQTFVNGLKFCDELNGKGFYFQLRNRVLLLDEYFQSLENLVKAQVYNPQKKRPWSIEDAKERWEQVKKEAQEDKAKCELVRSLPALEKQLDVLQKNAEAGKNADAEKKSDPGQNADAGKKQ